VPNKFPLERGFSYYFTALSFNLTITSSPNINRGEYHNKEDILAAFDK
jgi:hypothetical protein